MVLFPFLIVATVSFFGGLLTRDLIIRGCGDDEAGAALLGARGDSVKRDHRS